MVVFSKITSRLKRRIDKLEQYCSVNPINNSFGLARSLLALGTLLTLLFNSPQSLFTSEIFSEQHEQFVQKWDLFFVIGYSHLAYARIICVVILLLVISGWFPRITGLLHWWVSFSFFNAAIIVDGGDQITQVLTLFFIPLCLLDSRKNHWSAQNKHRYVYVNYLSYLCLGLIKLQICLLYLNAAIAKFNVDEWLDGTAMYYWLTNNTFGAPSYMIQWLTPMVENSFFVWVLTWSAIAFELLLAAALFFNGKYKLLMLRLGLLFHFTIFILLGLGSFFFAMAGSLVVYLMSKPLNINSPVWLQKLFTQRYKNLINAK